MEILKALIVDDENILRENVRSILHNTFKDIQFSFHEAENGLQALAKVKQHNFDLILMDVKMPEMNGLEALAAIKNHDPRTFVVLMTAHSNAQDAVLAIKEGAYDYIEKPIQTDRLIKIIKKALEARELISSLALSNPIFDDDIDSEFIGSSQKMKEVFSLINKLSKVDTTVLVRGENGTGKELVARAIHFNSPRKDGAFVAINCGAIPETLMESELFGHEKGAFTGASDRKIGKFQLANNGTIFLDELGELKPEMQVKLLRVLQDKKFVPVGSNREIKSNTRIIAATNKNLEKMIEDGGFREDLFYRLNVMPIFLPPLRERTDDLPVLIKHFIKKHSRNHTTILQGIEPAALDALKKYRWPGNIRELENLIERAFIVSTGPLITLESLPDNLKPRTKEAGSSENTDGGLLDYDQFKEQMEKEFIIAALKANKGRINQTVAQANIPKNTLLRKIKKYEIDVDLYKD